MQVSDATQAKAAHVSVRRVMVSLCLEDRVLIHHRRL